MQNRNKWLDYTQEELNKLVPYEKDIKIYLDAKSK